MTTSHPDFSGFSFGKFVVCFIIAATLAGLVLLVPALRAASLPADATGPMVVVFSPQVDSDQAFAAIHQAGGMPVRKIDFGNIWVVQAAYPGFVSTVDELGAAGSYRNLPTGIVLAGCTGVIAALRP